MSRFLRPVVKRPFLREKRLSNAQGRGPCKANAWHAPRRMIGWGRGIVRPWNWREIGALAQALLWEKGASKFIYQFSTVLFLDSVAREPKQIVRFVYFPFIYRFKVTELRVFVWHRYCRYPWIYSCTSTSLLLVLNLVDLDLVASSREVQLYHPDNSKCSTRVVKVSRGTLCCSCNYSCNYRGYS